MMNLFNLFQLFAAMSGRRFRYVLYWVFFFILLATWSSTAIANDDIQSGNQPKIIMLDLQGMTPNDVNLYHSIMAQLSVSPLTVDRIVLSDSDADSFSAAPRASASRVASENNAVMVFWIEDDEVCRLFFYIADENGGRMNSRTLKLELRDSWSRYQIIAIAAASMVEGLFVSYDLNTAVPPRRVSESTPSPKSVVESKKQPKTQRLFEVTTGYAGTLFADNLLSHGVGQGVGVRPLDNIVTTLSFAAYFPVVVKNDEYRLSISSHVIEFSAVWRWVLGAIDVRLGFAGGVDLRSFSATSYSESIVVNSHGMKGVGFFSPVLFATWQSEKKIGIFGRVGAICSLNDTKYSIQRIEGTRAEVTPYPIRFSFQLGIVILL